MRFEFLMVCHPEKANSDFLRELLSEALTESYDEVTDEELENTVHLSLSRSAPDAKDETGQAVNRTLCGFDLELPDETPSLQLVIENFTTSLTDTPGVEHVLKFYDDHLLNQNLAYMRELFGLEMKLRKVLSLIYLGTHCNTPYDLLKDDVESVRKSSDQKLQPDQLRKLWENEFFHLLFSQYGTLNKRKLSGKMEDMVELLRQTDKFEVFQREMTRIPIEDEADADFIVSLKELLNPVEKLRNSVAHNRTSSQKLKDDYQKAQEAFEERLEEFLRRFEPETA